MRLWFVALAFIALLLASAMAAGASGLPWVADYPAAGRSPYHAADVGQDALPVQTNPYGGFSSVDFLGQIRKQFDIGHLVSMFPLVWPGGTSDDQAADRVEFLGNRYERTNTTPLSDNFYYTGEQRAGRRIYVSAAEKNTAGVPDHIYLEDDGRYTTYAISGRPEIYAYVPGGTFNFGEVIRFGVANEGVISVELPNAAPFEVRRKVNGEWRTIFSPMAAQVITELPGGSRLSWEWDRRFDDGSPAPEGDYQVAIAGKYVAPFRIAGDMPVVEIRENNIDRAGIESMAVSGEALDALRKSHPSPSEGTKEDVISIMQYKAWALGLDAEQLRKAMVTAGDGLPCKAVHVNYEGQPAWAIVFSPMSGAYTPAVYVVEDNSGKLAYASSRSR